MTACGGSAEPPSRDIVVARAQPSVLQAISSFDVTLVRPAEIALRNGLDGKPLVEADYQRSRQQLPAGTTLAQFAWQRIAADPERYLSTPGPQVALLVEDQPYSTGTAFVVDDQGTLLTNQHVIDAGMVPNEGPSLLGFALEDMRGRIAAISVLLGGTPPADPIANTFDERLVPWLLSRYRRSEARLHEVRIATRLAPSVLAVRTLRIRPAPAVPDWKKSTVPCEVLVTGQRYPGKDVAVLRARSLAGKLISLPLGSSSRVVSGTRVHALGFPAAAVIPGVDPDAARFRVIAHDGIVDQRLPIEGGWEAFHMTANINHGDSGGPVVDDSGQVIAITVAGSNEAAAQNLAIPIDIGRQFLAQAKVIPFRGELTAKWYRACDEFAHQRYAEALPLLEEVNRAQGGWLIGTSGQATELIAHCKAEIGAGRGGSGAGATIAHWSDMVWQEVCALPLYQQLLLGFLALSILVGLLKALRAAIGWFGNAVGT